MRQYRYNPLFQKGSAIRVLELLPSRDKSSILRGKIIEYPLEDLDAANHVSEVYEALSYVWGGEKKPKSIIITENQNDGNQEVDSELSITQSLHDALLRLRHCHFPRILWVDAVCIDQTNDEEKEHQIQLMPLVYARAKCVLVWLGEAQDDSDMVLESIQAASGSVLQPPCDDTPTTQPMYDLRQGILKLLSRPWFSRMWILQEIGAARHVAILCGSSEIEGHAFSLGLNSLMKTWKTPFCSVTFLMRGAVFRPRRLSKKQTRFSLDICSLSELIDQYHTHETTIRHDKVYALIGMTSDDISTAGLEPDYKLAWAELFQRLVRFLLGNLVNIETTENTEVAIIKGKGCILGRVSMINTTQGWETKVTIDVGSNLSIPKKYSWESISCSLPSLPKPIKQGDLVCLLEGAQKPIIIRPYKCHFDVVMIGAVPRGKSREKLLNLMQSTKYFNWDFLLTWDSGNCLVESQDASAYDLTRSSDKSDLTSQLNYFTCLWNVALVLKDAPMDPKRNDEEMFSEAAKLHGAILKTMGLHVSPGDLSDLTPLSFAAKNGHAELASMLLAEGGNSLDLVDRNGLTPLSHAAAQGHLALVKLLLESGRPKVIAACSLGQTPLSCAAASGQEEVVKLLLKTDQINVNAKDRFGHTPLWNAAEYGHESIVKLLIKADQINVNAKDRRKQTPLFKAAEKGHEGVVKQLLEADKIDIKTKDSSGMTAISKAAKSGHEVVVKMLLDKGVDVDSRDSNGSTPLLSAASDGREAVVKMLLDNNADVNAKDMHGRTPLSYAAEEGHEAVVKILLDNKADVNSGTRSGRTSLMFAETYGHEAVIKLLRGTDVDRLM